MHRGDEGNSRRRVIALDEEAGIKVSINDFRFVSCGTGEDGEEE
jgi:hypothetical protein